MKENFSEWLREATAISWIYPSNHFPSCSCHSFVAFMSTKNKQKAPLLVLLRARITSPSTRDTRTGTFQISISRADDAVSRHERHFAYWCLQFYREKRMISLSAPLNRCERQTRGMEECTSGDLFAAVFRQSFPRNGFRQSTLAFNMIDIKPGWLDVSKACSRDFPRQAVCHSIPMIYSTR